MNHPVTARRNAQRAPLAIQPLSIFLTLLLSLAACENGRAPVATEVGSKRQALQPAVRSGDQFMNISSVTTIQGFATPGGEATYGFFRYRRTGATSCVDSDTWGARFPTSSASDTLIGSGTVEVPFSLTTSVFSPGPYYFVCLFARNSSGVASAPPKEYRPVNPDHVFDWAQFTYPGDFPGPATTQSSPPYVYRSYPSNSNFLGVNGPNVYIWGPVSGNAASPVLYDTLHNTACSIYGTACGPVLIANATQVSQGGTITVQLTRGFPTGVLKLMPAGAADNAPAVVTKATTGATTSWSPSVTADTGSYEFRYYTSSNSASASARSAPFSVVGQPSMSVSKTFVFHGEAIIATLSNGSTATTNVMKLAQVGTPDTASLASTTANGIDFVWTPTIQASAGTGQFEFRYFVGTSTTAAARSPAFTVYPAPTLSLSATAVPPGGTVTVTLTSGSTVTTNNLLKLALVGTSDLDSLASIPAAGSTVSWTPALLVGYGAGPFEFRYHVGGNAAAMVRSPPFRVTYPPSLTLSATTVAQGATISVTLANGSTTTGNNFIKLAQVGSADTAAALTSTKTNLATLTWTPTMLASYGTGQFEFRYYLGTSTTVTARSAPFTISAPPSLSVSSTTVMHGGAITVTLANGSTASTGNLIRLARTSSSAATSVASTAADGASFTWSPAILSSFGSGQFEFRYFVAGSTAIKARSPAFTISTPSANAFIAVSATHVVQGMAVSIALANGQGAVSGNVLTVAKVGSATTSQLASIAAPGVNFTWSPTVLSSWGTGSFEVRYFLAGSTTTVSATSAPFTVIAAPAPALPATTHVGATEATISVSPRGAANISVPLWTPPGVGAANPALMLRYDSSGGDGPFGFGWALGGLSSISRCAKTLASDGVVQGVTMTASDRFCLDGTPLKLTGGVYGASGSTYATELESFSRILAQGMQGQGPATFTVTSKLGKVATYGAGQGQAPAVSSSSTTIRSWLLTEIADRDGNAARFTYDNLSQSAPKLLEINYPYTATGAGPFYRVQLSYEVRPDPMAAFVAGSLIEERSRVTELAILELPSATLIKKYKLTYEQGPVTGRSRLRSVQECGATGCLEAIVVTSSNGAAGYETSSQVESPGPMAPYGAENPISVDFDGDGRSDVFYARPNPADAYTWNYLLAPRVRLSSPGTQWGYQPELVLTQDKYSQKSRPTPGRFFGRGRFELALPIPNQVTGLDPVIHIFSYNGTGFDDLNTGIAAPFVGLEASPYYNVPGEAFSGAADVNGDGLSDLLFVTTGWVGCTTTRDSMPCVPTGGITARLNQTTPGGPLSFGPLVSVFQIPPGEVVGIVDGRIRFMEFDRDGAADIVLQATGGWYFLKSNPGPSRTMSQSTVLKRMPEWSFEANHLDVLDWNGDGCDDIVTGLDTGLVEFSNCLDGYPTTGPTLPQEASTTLGTRNFIDYDGDGRTDLLYLSNLYRNGTSWVVGPWRQLVVRSTGLGATAPIEIAPIASMGDLCPGRNFTFVDVDGDALSDFTGVTCDPALPGGMDANGFRVFRRQSGADGLPPDRVTGLQTAAGTHQLTYASIARAAHVRGAGAVFPTVDVQPPMYVTTSLVSPDGIGGSFTTLYTYGEARTHAQGRGFLGFKTRTTNDSRNNVTSVETYAQTYPFIGQLVGERTEVSGIVLSRKTMTADQQGLGAGTEARAFTFVSSDETLEYEATGSKAGQLITRRLVETEFGDGFGNPTRVVTTVTDEDSLPPASPFAGSAWRHERVMTYDNSPSTWCLGLMASVSETRSAPGVLPSAHQSVFGRDTTMCRQTSSTEEPNDSMLSTTAVFGHDVCGNRNSVSVTGRAANGAPLPTRTTRLDYGARCQFIQSTTDALGQVSSTTYDTRFGAPTSKTDITGLTTTWAYDEYGRVLREVRPDFTYSLTRYDATTCPPLGAQLKIGSFTDSYSATGARLESVGQCQDQLNRTRVKRSIHPRRTTFTNDEVITYDVMGRVARANRPGSSSGSNGFERLEYDVLDRLVTRTLYSSATTLYGTERHAFFGRTSTVTDMRGATTTVVTDVMGARRSITEPSPGGTSSYGYDADGRLTRTTDAISKSRTTEYNPLGFVKAVLDPDRGLTTFAVNSFGEVTGQLNSRGKATALTLDTLGRLTSRTEEEGESIWEWGSIGSARGKPLAISGPGYTETMSYDQLGRLFAKVVTTADHVSMFNYRYNAAGQLETLSYPPSLRGTPNRLSVRYSYHEGVLVQVDDTTAGTPTTVWSAVSFSDMNGVTLQTVGATTPIAVQRSFEPHTGRLTSIQAGSGGAPDNLQSLTFAWDKNGNLGSRSNILNGSAEVFTNDALNRVRVSTLNGAANQSFDYDAAGNMTSRGGVGTYVYGDPNHPHAVTSAGSKSYEYDATGNAIFRDNVPQTWASFDLPLVLRANGQSTFFSYTPDRRVYKQVATYPAAETTHSLGEGFERVVPVSGVEEDRCTIDVGSGVRVLLTRTETALVRRSVLLDHIGSTNVIVNDATGLKDVSMTFGVFGERQSGTDWQGTPSVSDSASFGALSRAGYTGHPHLDNLQLVHMGARVYDPAIGRFLSVDPLVGDAPQALNPYSYVSNRPLSLVDATGMNEGEPLPRYSDFRIAIDSMKDAPQRETVEVTGSRERSAMSEAPMDSPGGFSIPIHWFLDSMQKGQRLGGQSEVRAGHSNDPTPAEKYALRFDNQQRTWEMVQNGRGRSAQRMGSAARDRWGAWYKKSPKPSIDPSPRAQPGDLPEYVYRGILNPAYPDPSTDQRFAGHELKHRQDVFEAAKQGIALAPPKYYSEFNPDTGKNMFPPTWSSYWTTRFETAETYANKGLILRLETRGIEGAFAITPEWQGKAPGEVRAFATFFNCCVIDVGGK